jgi:hypothetical protein
MTKSPIVKLRYEKTHFYLGSFPLSMNDLIQQTKNKLLPRNLIDDKADLKYRYCDPWNDMVEIQSDSDISTMEKQSVDRNLVLIEVSKAQVQKHTNWNHDLKGFISFLKDLTPDLGTHFNFIMEEGDQIPCEECLGKGILTRYGKKITCSNCSGCGARPISAFWELILKVIDYKLNQRIFDQVGKFLETWSDVQKTDIQLQPQLISGISFNTDLQNQKEPHATFNIQSEKDEIPYHPTVSKPLPNFIENSKARLSLGRAPLGFKEKLPTSSAENSDGENSLIKQSPLMTKQPAMGIFQYGFGAQMTQGLSSMSSSGLRPAAQNKIPMSISPKPTVSYSTEGRVRSITGKLQAFADIDFDKNLGGPVIVSDEEPKTTKKEIKFVWMAGPKEVYINPQKPQIRIVLKNCNDFYWGPWISFILKSASVKKTLPLEKEIAPGQQIDITITDLLQGIGEEVLVIQLKGVDENTYTKYTSERLELSIKLSK